LNRVEK